MVLLLFQIRYALLLCDTGFSVSHSMQYDVLNLTVPNIFSNNNNMSSISSYTEVFCSLYKHHIKYDAYITSILLTWVRIFDFPIDYCMDRTTAALD